MLPDISNVKRGTMASANIRSGSALYGLFTSSGIGGVDVDALCEIGDVEELYPAFVVLTRVQKDTKTPEKYKEP